MPDRELKGHVDKISALAKADFTTWPPPRNFDLTMAIDEHDERLRPGMTATIRVAVESVSSVLLVPPQALFSERRRGLRLRHVAWTGGAPSRGDRSPQRRSRPHPDRSCRGRTRRAEGTRGGRQMKRALRHRRARRPSRWWAAPPPYSACANSTPVPDRIPTTRPTRGDIEVQDPHDGRAGAAALDDHGGAERRRHAADRHALARRQRRQGRRRRDPSSTRPSSSSTCSRPSLSWTRPSRRSSS